MADNMIDDTTTLNERIQALPAEIYNEIYDLTSTPSSVTHITREYKPPASLQVSRATRRKFSELYYDKDRTFYVNHALAWTWLKSIETRVRLQIRSEIKITKWSFRMNVSSVFEMLKSLQREWDIMIGDYGKGSEISNKMGRNEVGLRERAGGPRWWPREHGRRRRSLIYCYRFQFVHGEMDKRAWVGFQELEECLGDPKISKMSATEWCEWKFGK